MHDVQVNVTIRSDGVPQCILTLNPGDGQTVIKVIGQSRCDRLISIMPVARNILAMAKRERDAKNEQLGLALHPQNADSHVNMNCQVDDVIIRELSEYREELQLVG